MKYIHTELGRGVHAPAGYYIPREELRLPYNGRDVLCLTGEVCVDGDCCGSGRWSYIQVPGFIVHWHSKLAPHYAYACAVLAFAGGALNPAFDQRDAARPFGNPAQGSPQQAGGYHSFYDITERGTLVSEIEPIQDKEARRIIREALKALYPNAQIEVCSPAMAGREQIETCPRQS